MPQSAEIFGGPRTAEVRNVRSELSDLSAAAFRSDNGTTIDSKDIVALIGGTGSGKTTLACSLLGDEFKLVHDEELFTAAPLPVKPRDDFSIGTDRFVAGTTTVSVQEIPPMSGAARIDDPLFVCDMPGQRNAGGPRNEIRYALMNQRAVRAAHSVRFVVCLSFDMFNFERGNRVLSVLSDLHDMFDDWDAAKASIAFCFTKVAPAVQLQGTSCVHLRQAIYRICESLLRSRVDMEGTPGHTVLAHITRMAKENRNVFVSNPLDPDMKRHAMEVVRLLPPMSGESLRCRLSEDGTAHLLTTLRTAAALAERQFRDGRMPEAAELYAAAVTLLSTARDLGLVDEHQVQMVEPICQSNEEHATAHAPQHHGTVRGE